MAVSSIKLPADTPAGIICIWRDGYTYKISKSSAGVTTYSILTKNGALKYEKNYKDGKEDGVQKEWYEYGKGTLRYEQNYKDGQYDGVQKAWRADGTPLCEYNYKDWKMDGVQKEWHPNGAVWSEKNYKDGELISEEEEG